MSSESARIVAALNALPNRAVAVVIPNWNGAAHLRRCLTGVAAQSRPPERVVVVDNGSVDDSVEMMRTEFPWVEVIALDANTGFAPAVNLGIRTVDTPLVALLNNDAVPDSEWLATLLLVESTADPAVGFLTSKIVTADGRFIDSAGDYLDDAGIAHQRGNGEPDTGQYDGQRDTFSACGCATMYRTEMLADVGHFDDDFFAYYEDVDLCLRARLRGWRGIYVGAAVVQHAVSATSGRMTAFKLFQGIRNSWFVLVKGIPAPLLPAVTPRFLVVQLIWLLRSARAGDLRVVVNAYGAVIRALPRLLRQRRRIQNGSSLPSADLAAMLVPSRMRARLTGVVLSRFAARRRSFDRIAGSDQPADELLISSVVDTLPAAARRGQVLVVGAAVAGISDRVEGRVVQIDEFSTVLEPARCLPFADAVFDAAVGADLLGASSVASQRELLAEMLRVTRPGGSVIVTAPHGASALRAERIAARLSRQGCASTQAVVPITVVDMRGLLKGLPTASVTVVRSAPVGLWILHKAVSVQPRRRLGLERLLALTLYLARSLPPSYRRVYVIRR